MIDFHKSSRFSELACNNAKTQQHAKTLCLHGLKEVFEDIFPGFNQDERVQPYLELALALDVSA